MHASCPDVSGCAQLELTAAAHSASGHHPISFQVLRQSTEAVDSLAQGTALVSREGLSLPGVTIPLGPKHARLRAGGVVTFEIEFRD